MKENGSDFHLINNFLSGGSSLYDLFPYAMFMANGRQCLIALIRQERWRRIWIPEYFCYEVIESIKLMTNIEILYYLDYPSFKDSECIYSLPFQKRDVILRVNYFGMRDFRSEKGIPIPVIEDHTHDLLSHWALNSDADWCIASLRKSIPIPEGGMVWSPKGHRITTHFSNTQANQQLTTIRWRAMEIKADYIVGKNVKKDTYRKLYIDTENCFNHLDMSTIDKRSLVYLSKFDIKEWLFTKKNNWILLRSLISIPYEILTPEKEQGKMFSLILLTNSKKERDMLRSKLIEKQIYPAILWSIPEDNKHTKVKDFSERMISIHCDGRYCKDDMIILANIINQSLIS